MRARGASCYFSTTHGMGLETDTLFSFLRCARFTRVQTLEFAQGEVHLHMLDYDHRFGGLVASLSRANCRALASAACNIGSYSAERVEVGSCSGRSGGQFDLV